MAPWLDLLLVGLCLAAAGGWMLWRLTAALRGARRAPGQGAAGGGGCGCSARRGCGSGGPGAGGVLPPVVGAKPANHR